MITHIAFLRGINVGGHKKIPKKLKITATARNYKTMANLVSHDF